ncbi:protein of unknown function [Enterobacter cancerogenus]|nr:protein of unknown function [Enterobacter cancerogenus]
MCGESCRANGTDCTVGLVCCRVKPGKIKAGTRTNRTFKFYVGDIPSSQLCGVIRLHELLDQQGYIVLFYQPAANSIRYSLEN